MGNDWSVWVEIGNNRLNIGDMVTIQESGIVISAHAYEGNETYDDYNYVSKRISSSSPRIQEIDVIVTEHNGRYAGGKAKWTFTIEIINNYP